MAIWEFLRRSIHIYLNWLADRSGRPARGTRTVAGADRDGYGDQESVCSSYVMASCDDAGYLDLLVDRSTSR